MVLAILLLIIGAILIFIALYNDEKGFIVPAVTFGVFFIWFGIDIISERMEEKEPTAMDVYKGKTTLEIIYRDNIPIDSIVVFKEQYKNK